MKHFLSLVVVLLITVTATFGQSGRLFMEQFSDLNDTLETSSTFTYDFNLLLFNGQDISHPWSYSVIVEADSLSGANAGTATLQFSNSPSNVSAANATWYNVSTETIDGATTQTFHFTGEVSASRARLVITSPSGTRETALKVQGTLKRKRYE